MSITGSEANGHSNGNGLEKPYSGHNELTRTMTLALSPDQYERLFFQPSAAKGDLSKRLGKYLFFELDNSFTLANMMKVTQHYSVLWVS
jgi:hypothetical protein